MSLMARGQETPQFAYNNNEGWTYSGGNPIPSSVYLYVTSEGQVLTLTSPEFSCQGIDSIAMVVTWKSNDAAIALTAAIDDDQGLPVDSATTLPVPQVSIQFLNFTVPCYGLSSARLRFVSWGATVNNAGAIFKIVTTPITASHETVIPGDADNNGHVEIADVTILIDYLLSGSSALPINLENADVDRDGNISISDVTALIDLLLT